MCRHCPGNLNPADEVSRGIPAQRFLTSERWFKSPAFLMKTEEDWPRFEIEVLPEDDQELKGEIAIFTLTLPEKLHELLVKYSSWTVLQRNVAWLLKFKACIQYRKHKKADIEKNLTTGDLEKETVTIVKLVQREAYAGFGDESPCQTFEQDGKSPTHIGWLRHESWRSHCRCPYCV